MVTMLVPGVAQAATPIPIGPTINATKQIDPCLFASEGVLKAVLQAGLTAKPPGYFPYGVQNGGSNFILSNPKVEQVTCPHMTITVTADVKYWETRGFPQFQTSGRVEFQSPLLANVVYKIPTDLAGTSPPVTSSNLVSADLALTHVNITSLKIDKVPRWLNPPWIRSCLNGRFPFCPGLVHEISLDVTPVVKVFLVFTTL
jgi:hypothetical protein